MATTRSINAPGIEIREIDRSSYKTQDNSLTNAPTVLIPGFADFGENQSLKWINTKATLVNTYGYPQNQFEQLFHNACIEVLNRGGVCLAVKLPYDNNESNGYTYCEYDVDTQIKNTIDSDISSILSVDSNIREYLEIKSSDNSGKITIDKLDDFMIRQNRSLSRNKITIVNTSKNRYTKAYFNSVSSENTGWNNKCLGIFPVIVTPTNAIFWQHIKDSSDIDPESCIDSFNGIDALSTVKYTDMSDFTDLDQTIVLSDLNDNLLVGTCSTNVHETTISKTTADLFPKISYIDQDHLNQTYLKQIGVAVLKAYSDSSNSDKVNIQILEMFVGSLDKLSKDSSGSSLFIDNIVNSNSKYINLFSNVDRSIIDKIDTFHICKQKSKMLGFYEDDCNKIIDVTKSIIQPLTTFLDNIKNPNQYPIDIICDAGVSNIAQYVKSKNDSNESDDFVWQLGNDPETIKNQTSTWAQVLKKFDDFCKYTRKDCMFIADCIRPFCLIGDQKIVRKTNVGSNVTKDILQRLRYLNVINSSYSAGYCNWLKATDAYSGEEFWCPPSIKAVSVYIYCDTYFHTWDAPAGFTRGILPNVSDVSFQPTVDEAGKIYVQNWNYAINYPEGIILEGQKTFQTNKTALDRVNVRRLLLGLEKRVSRTARHFLYEGNTEYLRQKFVDSIKQIFEDAVNGNGIVEYAIKCDDELNTTDVIENNELRCKIAIKPVKTIEYIILDFICTSQSANVTEEVMK